MTPSQKEEIVQKAATALSEHFDCVQILVSSVTPQNSTESIFRGSGNWFARQGMAKDFMNRDSSDTRAYYIAEKLNNGDK
jgi:hypothetical protein